MSARASAAIRLGTEGKAQVKADLREIANDGDAVATRWQRAFERSSAGVLSELQKQSLAARKLAEIQPATPMQRQVQAAASTSYTGGTAAESARFFAEQARATADLEARTRALVSAIDPAFAAQQRFNSEMAEARALVSAGTLTLDQYCDKLRLERTALEQSTQAGRRYGASSGQMRAGTQQLSYSIGDFATQVSMGQGVLMAFSAQMNQTIQALALMQKETKGFIGFMGGPWGAVIQGAILILGMLAGKYFDSSAAAKAKEKAAKDLTDQMDRLYEATTRQIKSEQQLQQETLNSAFALWKKAEATRLETNEKLKNAIADARVANMGDPNIGGFTALRANDRVSQLEAQLAANQESVSKRWEAAQAARVPILQGRAAEAIDKTTASTRRFDRAVDELNKRLLEGRVTGAAYQEQYGKLKTGYDAEQEALGKSEKKLRGRTDAQRAATHAQREAARDAKEYLRDLEALEDRYNPLAAATRKYREELEKISALRGKDAASADLFRQGARDAYLKERAGILGEAIDIEGVRADGDRDEDRLRRIEQRRRDMADSIEFAQRELSLVAANDNVRGRELEKLRFIQDLKRDLPDLTEDETAALVAQQEKLANITDQIAAQRRNWEEWQNFAGGVLDDVLNPDNWNDWGELGKKILKDLEKELIMLAALNPLKNMLLGTDLPTMGGVFGAIGGGGNSLMGSGGIFGDPNRGWKLPDPFGRVGGGGILGGFGLLSMLGGLFGFASGTEYAPGGWALVGENGPELAHLPRGSRVKAAGATRQALAEASMPAMNVNWNIDARGAGPREIDELRRMMAEQQQAFPGIAIQAVADAQSRIRGPVGIAA